MKNIPAVDQEPMFNRKETALRITESCLVLEHADERTNEVVLEDRTLMVTLGHVGLSETIPVIRVHWGTVGEGSMPYHIPTDETYRSFSLQGASHEHWRSLKPIDGYPAPQISDKQLEVLDKLLERVQGREAMLGLTDVKILFD